MKKVFYIVFLLFGVSLFAEGEVNATQPEEQEVEIVNTTPVAVKKIISATRGDIKVIEASENIRYLSQKMVKDYLFFYKNPKKLEVKRELDRTLLKLNDDFRIIVTTTKDSDTKDILEFLAYSKDQIEEIFNEAPSNEKAALMLDYSETLLEGADSIASAHKYDFSDEEKMLMVTKEMEYLLERVSKYYMALHVGFNSSTYREAMQESINQFEENIGKVNSYKYPSNETEKKERMNISWEANKIFLARSEDLFIPKLMFASVNHLEDVVAKIALYHSKNQ
jgi:hypothetical protein